MSDPHVWACVAPGRTRRMLKSEALAAGFEIDTRPPRGIGACGVRREFMHQAERAEIFNKTGIRVEDAAGKRMAFKVSDTRPAEKGEKAYDRFDAFAAEARGEGGGHLTSLESVDLWGDHARQTPFDAQDAYRRHAARIARGEPFSERA